MAQLALTLDERFEDIKFLIRDRGSNVTHSFDRPRSGQPVCHASAAATAKAVRSAHHHPSVSSNIKAAAA